MIDLCIALDGPLVGAMLPFCIESLATRTDMRDLRLHFIDRTYNDAIRRYLKGLIESFGGCIYQLHRPFLRAMRNELPVSNPAFHMARTLEVMADWCGQNEWFINLHYDVEFRSDWVKHYRRLMDEPEVAQIGCHQSGMVGYRREALRTCWVGFPNLSFAEGMFLCKNERGKYVIRCGTDSRCHDKSVPVAGWDVGELMELNLQALGWKVMVDLVDTWDQWRLHLGGASSGHDGSFEMHRARALEILQRRGLKEIK